MENTVLLFSPGLDSFLGDWVLSKSAETDEKITRIYFDINSRYSTYEVGFLKRWYPENFVKILKGPDMSKLEDDSSYIPNRNAVLATLAQSYTNADRVLLNATFDDRVSDGSIEFREHLSKTLSVSSGKKVIVDSLLKQYEKTTWVKKYIDENPNQILKVLEKTFSCYNVKLYNVVKFSYFRKTEKGYEEAGKINTMWGCMSCVACYRRLCSFILSNIYVPFNKIEIINKYIDSNIDEKLYPKRLETVREYYNFTNWYNNVFRKKYV